MSAKTSYYYRNVGFTLIEVMVVVIILGILAVIVITNYADKPCEARIVKAKQDIRALESALEMYKLANFHYPSSDQGLDALVTKPAGSPEPQNWKQYVKRLPKDPWGKPYQYILLDDRNVELATLGADAEIGGEECNADIKNSDLN